MKILLKDLLIILVLPNLTFHLISSHFGAERSLINIDYAICALIYVIFRNKILLLITLSFCIFFDFINIFKQLFFFVRASDIFYLLKYSLYSSNEYKILGFLILIIIISFFLIYTKNHLNKKNTLIIFNILLTIYITTNVFLLNKIITISYTLNYFDVRNTFFYNQFYENDTPLMQKDMESVLSINDLNLKKNVLFIIVESFGLPHIKEINQEITAPLNKIIKLKKQGDINYTGFTIGAEMREFCSFEVINYNIKNSNIDFNECLVNKINKLGYESISVHGTSGFMYDRKYWYPKIGFKNSIFLDSGLNLKSISMCKSFPGACDQDIAMTVVNQLNQNKKTFLYWLTLNTHHPYKLQDLKIKPFNCKKYNIEEDSAACRNLSLQNQFFNSLTKVIKNYKGDSLQVILVGDHTPPMPLTEKEVFVKNKVPYYIYEK